MSISANKCHKCGDCILGTYCYKCDCDIRLVINPFPDGNPLEDFFDNLEGEENDS